MKIILKKWNKEYIILNKITWNEIIKFFKKDSIDYVNYKLSKVLTIFLYSYYDWHTDIINKLQNDVNKKLNILKKIYETEFYKNEYINLLQEVNFIIDSDNDLINIRINELNLDFFLLKRKKI